MFCSGMCGSAWGPSRRLQAPYVIPGPGVPRHLDRFTIMVFTSASNLGKGVEISDLFSQKDNQKQCTIMINCLRKSFKVFSYCQTTFKSVSVIVLCITMCITHLFSKFCK